MFAKKIYHFTAKSFNSITSSLINGAFNTSAQDGFESDDINDNLFYYKIMVENKKDFINPYTTWIENNPINYKQINNVALLPFFSVLKNKKSFFEKIVGINSSSIIKKNCIQNRAVFLQYAANSPIEDRIIFEQIENVDGYLIIFVKGCDGWQLSEFVQNEFTKKFQKYITKVNDMYKESSIETENMIINCFQKIYDSIEKDFFLVAKKAKDLGFSDSGNVGASASSIFIHGNQLYMANSGNCETFLIKKEYDGLKCINTRTFFQKKENSLENKNEAEIMTRCFGKYNKKILNIKGEKFKKKISHEPEILVIKLDNFDEYLLIISKEIYEYIDLNDLNQIFNDSSKDKTYFADQIFKTWLKNICLKKNILQNDLMSLPLGELRRKIHDDISFLVVDLRNQFQRV